MAPRPKGKWPPQSHDFAHDSIPPAQPRVKQEERESALHAPREQWQPSAYGDPPTSYTLPPRPSFSSSSRISTTVPPSPTFSTRSTHPSATSLYPEPEHGADVHDRLELGGHTSGLSAREKELAQELVHRGVYRSVAEREAMQSEIVTLRARLKEESQARYAAEVALQEERRQREQAEAVMGDMRRECNAPFVVPSLFEAFTEISRLTGKCIPVGAAGAQ
ncbi:hypothetical protein C8Q72DRAFT_796393 [Fomitopsis betulina]|nr:hypothetical protein C8Q72DRAFT_796393 [Fomitopsis betulina]